MSTGQASSRRVLAGNLDLNHRYATAHERANERRAGPVHECVFGVPRTRTPLITHSHTPHTVGRFLLTPLIRKTDCGRHRASLSIRSGEGAASHDRVLRFVPLFTSMQAAARYALKYGTQYVRQRYQVAAA